MTDTHIQFDVRGRHQDLDGLIEDLKETLTTNQRNLVLGLSRGSVEMIEILKDRIPTGTRELLVTHGALNESGELTELGNALADRLAYEQGEGPDPDLLRRAYIAEHKLLET